MTNVHFMSESNEWATPQDLYDAINAKYGPFQLDAAATDDNHKAPIYYTMADDGLRQNWHHFRKVWCNPPYGRSIKHWVKKACEESAKGCFIVMLLPARPGSGWFHDYVLGQANVIFLRGRLKFGNSPNSAPFDSMIAIYRPKPCLLKDPASKLL